MFNFTMCLSTKVLFGKGQISNIKDELPKDANILVTYGGGSVYKNGVMDQVHKALEGFNYYEFGGIQSNPQFEYLKTALPLIKEKKIDYLLAVGGGSVVDGTKFLSVASKYYDKDNLWEILLTHGSKIKECIPIGCIMTIAATGSEMNSGAVISRKETHDKLDFYYGGVLPKFCVLDPSVTFTLPVRQTANGVVDAFAHTAEGYMTYPAHNDLTDRYCEGIFATLMENGPLVLKEPDNYDARANIMWCATNALNHSLMAGIPGDGLSHLIGHELTGLYGVDHGRTLAVVMPAVFTYEKEAKKQKLAQFAKRVLNKEGTDDELADFAIKGIRSFFEEMGTGTHLSDYGIGEEEIPKIVEKLAEHKRFNCGEHGNINPPQMGEILKLAL